MKQNLTEQMSTAIQIIDDAVKNIKEQAENDVAELLRAKATMMELASRWRLYRLTLPTQQPDSGDRAESPGPIASPVSIASPGPIVSPSPIVEELSYAQGAPN